jgi:hypothetical protein
MRQAREALKALPPEEREQLWYGGIGPGDSYIGMWRMVNAYRFRLNALFKGQTRADVPPLRSANLKRTFATTASRSPPYTASCSFMRNQSWRR